MTTVISITGNRASGKTSMAIELANQLSVDPNIRLVVIVEGPKFHADHVRRYCIYRNTRIKSSSDDLRWFRHNLYDYVIYDGYLAPETNQHYNLSPIIDEEIIKRYSQ